MKRNIAQQVEQGKKIMERHPGADITVSEINQFYEAYKETAAKISTFDAVWDVVRDAFIMGVAVGARNK